MPDPSPSLPRIALLDVLRGIAIAAMAVYHVFFDLEWFGLADFGVSEHEGWVAFARAIPAAFLAIAGTGLYLAHRNGIRWRGFWWRIGYLAAAAALVTIVSYYVDPEAIIWFGILHCIAVSSVLGLAFLFAPPALTVIAAALVLAGPLFPTSALNSPLLLWIGLGTEEPPSDDYNPLFPWFGFLLIGIALARLLAPHAANAAWAHWTLRDPATRTLALAGRHSLLIYLAHQPVLFALLFGLSRLIGTP